MGFPEGYPGRGRAISVLNMALSAVSNVSHIVPMTPMSFKGLSTSVGYASSALPPLSRTFTTGAIRGGSASRGGMGGAGMGGAGGGERSQSICAPNSRRTEYYSPQPAKHQQHHHQPHHQQHHHPHQPTSPTHSIPIIGEVDNTTPQASPLLHTPPRLSPSKAMTHTMLGSGSVSASIQVAHAFGGAGNVRGAGDAGDAGGYLGDGCVSQSMLDCNMPNGMSALSSSASDVSDVGCACLCTCSAQHM